MKLNIKTKIQKPKSRLIEDSDETHGLRDLDSNLIVNLLEDKIELRETPLADKIKKKLSSDKSKSLNIQQ